MSGFRSPIRRRRLAAIGLAMLIGAIALSLAPASRRPRSSSRGVPGRGPPPTQSASTKGSPRPAPPRPVAPPVSFAVGLGVLRLVDTSRVIHFPNGRTEPRTLLTEVRYPVLRARRPTPRPGAPPARAAGPFPLVVFGHGFTVTPAVYARLLGSWARAGYVVAAPVFPLENANAPGGPDESDLINQPADMRFVITRLLQATREGSGPLRGLVDPARIAVTGQSDGGETALAVAYDRHFADARVRAAVILSGAEIPGAGGFSFPDGSPPLLATQGTADTVNPPSFTHAFFDIAPRPKFLLNLLGASHLPPYTDEQPQLGIVERVTTAFLDHYLKHVPRSLERLVALGNRSHIATLLAEP